GLQADIGDIGQVNNAAAVAADHQLACFGRGFKKIAGLNLDHAVVLHERLQVTTGIGAEQGIADIVKGQTVAVHACRVEANFQHRLLRTDGVNITGAGNALEFGFQRVGDLGQVGGADIRAL